MEHSYALPEPPADFSGRESELRALRQAVTVRHETILGLRGKGGVGKTALALVLANGLKGQFRDAQLFIELPETKPLLAPATVMGDVIHAFYPTAKLPDDATGMKKAYSWALHERRVLLVLDNVPDGFPLAPFIPPVGCLVLATSQERIAPPQWHVVNLDRLPLGDAQGFLLKAAPRIGDRALELAELCGGMPLALRLAGQAMAANEQLDPADYANRLQTEQWQQVELDEVQASLAVSYDLLTADLRQKWRQLVVFPVDFALPAAAAVWAVSDGQSQPVLDELRRFGLVAYDNSSTRYRLHDQTRRAASERIEPLEREEALQRHAAHFGAVLAAADRLVSDDGDNVTRGLRLFDRERANIMAGHAWAVVRLAEDETAAKLAGDYPIVGSNVLSERQPLEERLAWLETAGVAAQWLSDRGAQAIHLGKLGSVYRHRNEPQWAIEYYERHLRIARELGDLRSESAALGNLGLTYADLGNMRRAVEYYQQSLLIAQKTGVRREQARTSWNLGLAYVELGDLAAAIAAMEFCVHFEREMGHPDAETDAEEVAELRLRLARQGPDRRP